MKISYSTQWLHLCRLAFWNLKKHETCSDPSTIVDSPEAKGAEEEGYFDEIRSFMGKVTSADGTSRYSPSHLSDQDIDVEEDEIMDQS